MTRVWLIRHCHPAISEGVRMCLGRTDLPLSQKGTEDAAALGIRFRDIPLTHVYCSHLSRSIQTAQALAPSPIILSGLEEQDMGQWDGLTFSEIKLRYPELYAARGQKPTLLPPDSEPDAHALTRFQSAMSQAASIADGDFAVVSHGGVISLFLEHLTGTRYKPAYGEAIWLHHHSGHSFSISSAQPTPSLSIVNCPLSIP